MTLISFFYSLMQTSSSLCTAFPCANSPRTIVWNVAPYCSKNVYTWGIVWGIMVLYLPPIDKGSTTMMNAGLWHFVPTRTRCIQYVGCIRCIKTSQQIALHLLIPNDLVSSQILENVFKAFGNSNLLTQRCQNHLDRLKTFFRQRFWMVNNFHTIRRLRFGIYNVHFAGWCFKTLDASLLPWK